MINYYITDDAKITGHRDAQPNDYKTFRSNPFQITFLLLFPRLSHTTPIGTHTCLSLLIVLFFFFFFFVFFFSFYTLTPFSARWRTLTGLHYAPSSAYTDSSAFCTTF